MNAVVQPVPAADPPASRRPASVPVVRLAADGGARLSALDGWIDILRTGDFVDMNGRNIHLDESHLDDLAAAFAAGEPVPVVVGHPEHDDPAWAWLASVRRVGDRLQATLDRVDEGFRAAVEAGRYAGRSLAFSLSPTRIWHLGFLGGAAPAVSGLNPSRFSGPSGAAEVSVVEFAAGVGGLGSGYSLDRDRLDRVLREMAWSLDTIGDWMRGQRERAIEADGIERANSVAPGWPAEALTDSAARIRASLDEAGGGAALAAVSAAGLVDAAGGLDLVARFVGGRAPAPQALLMPEATPQTQEDAVPENDAAALAAREAALAERENELKAREERTAREAALAAASAIVGPMIADGRITPAQRPLVEAALAALPGDDVVGADGGPIRISLASPDPGGQAEEISPRAALTRFLESLGRQVDYRELAPSRDAEIDAGGDPAARLAGASLAGADQETINRSVVTLANELVAKNPSLNRIAATRVARQRLGVAG